MKSRLLRALVALAFLALTAAGLAWHTGWGTLSSFGFESISLICPLGSLESMIAGNSLAIKTFCALVLFVLFVIILGRVFCGWMCPVPLVRHAVTGSEHAGKRVIPIAAAQGASPSKKNALWDFEVPRSTPYYVLLGALASTAVFGFPVFCLICPVGLTFALLIAIWQLFAFNDPSWSIVFFALVLFAEIFLLRRWCHQFCPLGALVSLVSRLNTTLRPTVDEDRCLRSCGMDCEVCRVACPEGIDLHGNPSAEELSRCTKCRACAESCPNKAISFPFSVKEAFAGLAGLFVLLAASMKRSDRRESDPEVMTLEAARTESSRCILCGKCTEACPEHKPIAEWMHLVQQGRPRKAAELLVQAGSMPEVCARVCPHERLCESVCPLSAASRPVAIHAVELAVAEAALKRGTTGGGIRKKSGRVAVIGSGPSGLACAQVLAERGVAVTVFESEEMAGGLLTFGIPASKLARDIVARRVRSLERAGVRFRFGVRVGKEIAFSRVASEFDAVYAALGAPLAVMPEKPGFELDGVMSALHYLRSSARHALGFSSREISLSGKRVAVLGGGDTAIDCVRSALEEGAERVTCVVRKDEQSMRALPRDAALVRAMGAKFVFGAEAVSIDSDEKAHACAVRLQNTLSEPDASFVERLEADAVIVAFGQRASTVEELVRLGVKYDGQGRIQTDGTLPLQCSGTNVFAGGDACRGPDLAVRAVADGRQAACSILEYLAARGGRGEAR